jgi:hypothetical protein
MNNERSEKLKDMPKASLREKLKVCRRQPLGRKQCVNGGMGQCKERQCCSRAVVQSCSHAVLQSQKFCSFAVLQFCSFAIIPFWRIIFDIRRSVFDVRCYFSSEKH